MTMQKTIAILLTIATILVLLFFVVTPSGRSVWNSWFHEVQKADDRTSYQTKKKVEDTCRSMIASYNADKMIYEQYKDSDNSEKQSWGEQARIRANRTVAMYNEYVLKNNYIWVDNIPSDIFMILAYLE